MYVGVILFDRFLQCVNLGIPHVCGGDPDWWRQDGRSASYSPCMWG